MSSRAGNSDQLRMPAQKGPHCCCCCPPKSQR